METRKCTKSGCRVRLKVRRVKLSGKMWISFVLLISNVPGPLDSLDKLAQARDYVGMLAYCAPGLKVDPNPFLFLKNGGAYGTGRYGWNALQLKDADGKATWAVFTTKLTSEDIGEQVFEWRDDKLQLLLKEADTQGFKVGRNDMVVAFDIPTKTADILCQTRFERTGPTKPSFMVRFSPQYRVSDIKDGDGKPVKFAQVGGIVSIAAPIASRFTYTLRYRGVVNLPGFAGAINAREASLTNDYWWPMIARNPAPYSVTVRGPKGWTAVGQGEQTEMKETTEGRITSFRMDLPVSYYSLSCGMYKSFVERLGTREYRCWSNSASDDSMKVQTAFNRTILDFYNQTISKYPFTGWGFLESVVYGGGALEAYSYATYGGGIGSEDAHEPAHTWWGGMIPNTYLHSLWNESFADYSMGLYARNVPLGNVDERRLAFITDALPSPAFNVATCAQASAEIGPAATEIGYGKGAYVLQMLEQEIGTEAMVKTLRQWIETHPKGTPGEWEDYERVAQAATGKDLKWFFNQWLRRKGWADFEVTDVQWAAGRLSGKVKWSSDPYRIHCEILLVSKAGRRTFSSFDTMQARDGVHYRFDIACPERPTLVSVDPWRRLLRRQKDDEVPIQLEGLREGMKVWVEKGREAWGSALTGSGRRSAVTQLPADLDGTLLVGHPEKTVALKPLCDKVGFKVNGDSLTYDGTTIDLRTQGAMAVVDLGQGKSCIIALGNPKRPPHPGRARLVLCDELGRFLRGVTDPKTSGWMTFKLSD